MAVHAPDAARRAACAADPVRNSSELVPTPDALANWARVSSKRRLWMIARLQQPRRRKKLVPAGEPNALTPSEALMPQSRCYACGNPPYKDVILTWGDAP